MKFQNRDCVSEKNHSKFPNFLKSRKVENFYEMVLDVNGLNVDEYDACNMGMSCPMRRRRRRRSRSRSRSKRRTQRACRPRRRRRTRRSRSTSRRRTIRRRRRSRCAPRRRRC